jgi:LacI family transcriptional regulator
MASSSDPRRSVTIHDVAARAGVSKSTVSLVLQDSPLVSVDTAKRVRQAAREVGYVYNRRAAGLRQQRSNLIGVVINDLMNPFFAELLVGAERQLSEAGFISLMAHTQEDLGKQSAVLQSMREHHAAGILLCPAIGTPASLIRKVAGWNIPLTVMVRSLGPTMLDFSGSDNVQGMLLATRHLIARGHRRIGFLCGPAGDTLSERLDGYRRALGEHQIDANASWIVEGVPSREGGARALHALLDLPRAPTAAVCYNDVVAFGALAALTERGLTAGRDFDLMGFDNVMGSAQTQPALSTVDVAPAMQGEQAARLLLARMRDDPPGRQRASTQPTLILRASA